MLLGFILAVAASLSLLGGALYLACGYVLQAQDLRKKYRAKWALVTGASSGIGLQVARALARSNLDVVLVALPDALLDEAACALQEEFQQCRFRKVGVDMTSLTGEYMPLIAKATADITVQLIFLNAGYTIEGYFQTMAVQDMRKLVECNCTAALAIAHFFVNKMADAGLRGCVVFTSSMSCHMPGPLVAVYAATKAALSMFAASLAVELHQQGIDVLAVCPGPVLTRYFQREHKQPSLKLMKQLAMDPAYVAQVTLASVGRAVVVEVGLVSALSKFLMRWLDFNVFTLISSRLYAHTSESRAFDYR